MNDTGSKQQIVEKIKDSSNILVTVSTNPSVDELSAALGLTLLLNKMNKHATAVFSGAIPPAITFLDPQKTFENTVDSLRDFIIALDKEKADHLRYKVDGDVVKIFITPYRTTISSDDLDFSQGDYNVEFVMALGVKSQDHLDSALEAHGRILHDATVATISVGEEKSELGSIDWNEKGASSLSELLVGLSDSLKNDKPLLDEQIATAFLTGIVAATDRFSNNRTSSRVMTIAAQLMGAGANQQLIASKLEEAHEIGGGNSTPASTDGQNSDGTTNLSEGESTKVEKKNASRGKKAKGEPKKDDGSLTISHEREGNVDEVAKQASEESQEAAAATAQDQLDQRAKEVSAASQESAAKAAEQKLATQLADVAPAASATPSVADLQKDLAAASADVNEASNQQPPTVTAVAPGTGEPSMGGTLNATTEQAADDARRALEDDRNHTILTHGGNSYVGDSGPTFQSPLNAASQPSSEPPLVDPFAELPRPVPTPQPSAPAPTPAPTLPPVSEPADIPQPSAPTPPEPKASYEPTLADIDQQNRAPHEEARAAVEAAFGAVPFNPSGNPEEGVGAQPLGGTISHDSPSAPPPPAPTLPPLPDFSTLPPLPNAPEFNAPQSTTPPDKLEDVLSPAPAPAPTPQSNDPGQFKIPGQLK
jgi:hypothetical protein